MRIAAEPCTTCRSVVADHHQPGPHRRPGTAGNAETGVRSSNRADVRLIPRQLRHLFVSGGERRLDVQPIPPIDSLLLPGGCPFGGEETGARAASRSRVTSSSPCRFQGSSVPRSVKYTARLFIFRTGEAAWLHKGTVESHGRPTTRRDVRPRPGGPVHQVPDDSRCPCCAASGEAVRETPGAQGLELGGVVRPAGSTPEKAAIRTWRGGDRRARFCAEPAHDEGFRRTALAGRLPCLAPSRATALRSRPGWMEGETGTRCGRAAAPGRLRATQGLGALLSPRVRLAHTPELVGGTHDRDRSDSAPAAAAVP